MKTSLKVLLYCFIGVFVVVKAVISEMPMKGVYLWWAMQYSQDASKCGSLAALQLYKKMGYNTVFEEIILQADANLWNKTFSSSTNPPYRWKMKTTTSITTDRDRDSIIKYIRLQKERINALGMEYCPSSQGWSNYPTYDLDKRGQAAIYREVDYIKNYYGTALYSSLINMIYGGYVSPWPGGSQTWSTGTVKTSCTFTGANNGSARITMPIVADNAVRNKLIYNQCYKFQVKVNLTGKTFQKGDNIALMFFREFVPGEKPNPAYIPLGKWVNQDPNNNSQYIAKKLYDIIDVKNVSGSTLYTVKDRFSPTTFTDVTSFTDEQIFWMEKKYWLGTGNYNFTDNITWDMYFELSGGRTGSIKFDNFSVSPVDPRTQLAYPDWEKSSSYTTYTVKYPLELYMTTKATFYGVGEKNYYAYIKSNPSAIPTRIRGNFFPLNMVDFNPNMHSDDPLSPVFDLYTKEALSIIKEGLGGKEPKYVQYAASEVYNYKRDAVSIRNGPANTIYNQASNMEYWGQMLEKYIENYKLIFKGSPTAPTSAKFVCWADMIMPWGYGYTVYAEKNQDSRALEYIKNSWIGTNNIIISLWIYPQSIIPGSNPPQILLQSAAEMQTNINMIKNQGLSFSVLYATDCTNKALEWVTNGNVNTPQEHIQHEIDMTRSWFDIIKSNDNESKCEGVAMTAWPVPQPWDALSVNSWNGLYYLAYFGWCNPSARDLPVEWKLWQNGADGEPVLNFLTTKSWPPADIVPSIQLLLE